MTLKVRSLRCLRRLFIILVSLTMTWFSEKMLIFKTCRRVLMPNLIKKSWTVSTGHHLRRWEGLADSGLKIKDLALPTDLWNIVLIEHVNKAKTFRFLWPFSFITTVGIYPNWIHNNKTEMMSNQAIFRMFFELVQNLTFFTIVLGI